jgi:hypothetical protein
MIALMHADGRLRVRSGVQGTWVETPAYGAGVVQYDPLVSVPSPPYRTTLATHIREHNECGSQPHCYPYVLPAVPAPLYGRFCGGDVPNDWNWAVAQGPVDTMDKTCKHHDLAQFWYPEVEGLPFQTCIVRYALRYSRLTQNGTLLTHGADSNQGWMDGWGSSMPALRGVLDVYFSLLVNTCPDSALEDFEVITR